MVDYPEQRARIARTLHRAVDRSGVIRALGVIHKAADRELVRQFSAALYATDCGRVVVPPK